MLAIAPELSADDLLTRQTSCFVCASHQLKPIHDGFFCLGNTLKDPEAEPTLRPFEGKHFLLNQCQACGFIQAQGIPIDPNYFTALYNQKWSEEWMLSDFDSVYKDNIFQGILHHIGKSIRKSPRSLLDVGTHVGKMIHLAGLAGWQADGIELNPRTREIAIRKTGRPVHRMTAKQLSETGVKYDAVTITDVLEHIPDPVSVLTDLRSLMNPNGMIAIKVPSGANQLRKEKFRTWIGATKRAEIGTNFIHVNHFSPTALRTALVRAGFVQPWITVGAPELPPGGGFRGLVSRCFRQAVFSVAKLPGGVHTPLGLNLQAFARVPE